MTVIIAVHCACWTEQDSNWSETLNGLQSVSYTHLDVYKRQIHNNLTTILVFKFKAKKPTFTY